MSSSVVQNVDFMKQKLLELAKGAKKDFFNSKFHSDLVLEFIFDIIYNK